MTKNAREILKDIRQNVVKDKMPNKKHGVLLSIDMDEHYTPRIDTDFLLRYTNFLNSIRDHVDVVHVWHNIYWKKRTRLGRNAGRLETCEEEKNYNSIFDSPIRPRTGERVLGKNAYSAFCGTNLEDYIPKDAPVFVMGTLGQDSCAPKEHWCIDETIREGLKLGFNMIAIPDMINERYARRHYKGLGRAPIAHSASLLKAFNIEAAANDNKEQFYNHLDRIRGGAGNPVNLPDPS